MSETDGGDGMIGSRWVEFWPVDEILETACSGEQRYEDVLLFAGDGANTVYGFDARNGNSLIEGDWIGLNRDELIYRGRNLEEFIEMLSSPG